MSKYAGQEEELWFYQPDDDETQWKKPVEQSIHRQGGWGAWRVVGFFLTASVAALFLLALLNVTAGQNRPVQLSSSGMPDITPAPIVATPTEFVTMTPAQPTARPMPAAGIATPLFPTQIATPQPGDFSLDNGSLQQLMLNLINQDREANGLTTVAWDETAAQTGQLHAEEMVQEKYFSHWNSSGLGPDHRYVLAGGAHAVMENSYAYWHIAQNGQGAPTEDWEAIIVQAEQTLMNSPGHRANILNPAHTHVGIGMAYDAATGHFRLTQEFVNQYVVLERSLPLTAAPGSSVRLQGQIGGNDHSRLLFSLAFEPFPATLSLPELAQRNTYVSPAQSVEVRELDSVFDELITLGERPGLYHIRLFLDIAGEQTLVMDHVVWVGQPAP